MDEEKLELINLLSQYNSNDIQQMLIIMTYWEEMVKNGIVTKDDINNLSSLTKEKQRNIKKFVKTKLKGVAERKQNGN